MKNGELVSIITPCYNTEKLVPRLLDSVLKQDYPYVEMFAVNDGSSDNTLKVLESYIPIFASKGYSLYVSTQENAGQAAAVNSILRKVNGDYLVWPDSDDFYTSKEALSTFVKALKNLDDTFGMVRCIPNFYEEESLTLTTPYTTLTDDENQFENCLFNCHFIWPPVSYMIRMKQFRTSNPRLQIDSSWHAPQNWQMLLPLLYSYKCFTIYQPVAGVLERNISYSRKNKSYEQVIEYINRFERIINSTLDNIQMMPQQQKEEYKRKIRLKYAKEKFNISCGYKDVINAEMYKKIIAENNGTLTTKEQLKYILVRFPFLYSLFQ